MMEQYESALIPCGKENASANGAQFPNIPIEMFDIWLTGLCAVQAQHFYIITQLIQLNAAVLIVFV